MQHRNLASERTRLGMTQDELAKKLNIGIRPLVKYEKDATTIPPAILGKAADLFPGAPASPCAPASL